MNKKILFLIAGLICILVIAYLFYFLIMPVFGGGNNLNASCGAKFNKIYKQYANEGKSPDFCLNIDKIKIGYRRNIEGFSYCFAFNGHEFFNNSLEYPGRISQTSTWIGAAMELNYNNPLIKSSGPITSGSCIESFSVYTKKNYCNILPLPKGYTDICTNNLAYYYNDISLCDKATIPYHCYALLAKKDHNPQYCDKVPDTKVDPTDQLTLKQTCVNSATYLSPNQISKNKSPTPASPYGKALSDPKQECLKDGGRWIPCDEIKDYLSLNNIDPNHSTASECKAFSTTSMGYGARQYLNYPNYGCDCGTDSYWSFSWNTCVKPGK
jgi:hypothetical protein